MRLNSVAFTDRVCVESFIHGLRNRYPSFAQTITHDIEQVGRAERPKMPTFFDVLREFRRANYRAPKTERKAALVTHDLEIQTWENTLENRDRNGRTTSSSSAGTRTQGEALGRRNAQECICSQDPSIAFDGHDPSTVAMSDALFGDNHDCKSTGGFIIRVFGGFGLVQIREVRHRDDFVHRDEFLDLSHVVKEVRAMKRLCSEVEFVLSEEMTIFCDHL
ncbi:hypothetical protein CP533_0804 [Ophiocordyceps camponoti-saundersi (nom. inval.)]|nr:hypothetical protein CP533_0804 [Ophiocordyceps camponoti-saundersi (nom. inval.)]